MNSKNICDKNGFDLFSFETFVRTHFKNMESFRDSKTIGRMEIYDELMLVNAYKAALNKKSPEEMRIEAEAIVNQEVEARAAKKAEAEREAIERALIEEQRASIEKQRALSQMLITSGFNFDGYRVVKYSGYISGDDCVTLPRNTFWGNNKLDENLCGALVKIRRQAIKELKEAAYDLGCNAVIGVDFDYLTMDPQHAGALNATVTVYEPYVICVTANGNAVVIEKEE